MGSSKNIKTFCYKQTQQPWRQVKKILNTSWIRIFSVDLTDFILACVAGRRKGGKSKSAREVEAQEGEGTACKDAIVYFVFFVHQTNVKILIGQI